MSTQTIFKARPYRGEEDIPAVWGLYEACEAVDKLDHGDTIDFLRLFTSSPELDPEQNLRVWEDAGGDVVGFARFEKPAKDPEAQGNTMSARLDFRVHPSVRNQGLEREVLDWAGSQVHEIAAKEGLEGVLYSGTRDSDAYGREVLESNGFGIARYFFRMARSLNEPIPDPVFPEGYSLSNVKNNEDDLREWLACFNQSFIDHWNFHPITYEEALHWNENNADYRHENDLVAVAPDGTYAAFCYTEVNEDDNRRNGRRVGWIHLLGTRRGHRNKGLGTAMLFAGFQHLKDVGQDTAKLGVDAENLTGALRLYESVGFKRDMTNTVYSKRV